MTNEEFKAKFHGIIEPAYRGAAYPEFDPAGINESKIEDECRYKNFTWKLDERLHELYIDWLTQESADKHALLWKEVKRCLEYIGFDGQVVMDISSRNDDQVYTLTKRWTKTINSDYEDGTSPAAVLGYN